MGVTLSMIFYGFVKKFNDLRDGLGYHV